MLDKTQNKGSNESPTYNEEDSSRSLRILFNDSCRIFEKSFMLSASHLRRTSGVGSRRFARPQKGVAFQSQALNLILVNSSSMVATGSGSSESMNLPSSHSNTHGILDINILNMRPADRDDSKGIMNCDSLVIYGDFGMDKEPVASKNYADCPKDCCPEIFASGIKQSLQDKKYRSHKQSSSKDVTASGSKNFGISHVEIFSRKVAS